MPSPPKERPSGRLGRLLAALRPSRAGPLPVQTGFPTSLADLVVKNHGRLKKQPSPSSKRGKRGAAAAASPPPSVSPPPSPSPPPASPPPPTAAVGVSPTDRPRPDLPPARLVRRGKGCGGDRFALGLGFLAVSGVVSLALLVIWSKKVVAAVTAASFSLFLLESVRSSLRPRRPRPAATERRICLDGLGRVSPIREVDDAEETEPPRPSCSDTDRGSEASILAAGEKSGGALDESSSPKAKKRSWKKKLIASAKKLNKGRKSKEADSPGSFRSDGDPADASVRRGNASSTDPSDSRRGAANQTKAAAVTKPDSVRGSRRSSEEGIEEIVAAAVEIDDAPPSVVLIAEEEEEEAEEGGGAGSRFPAGLVLVAIVLVGLVAGKVPAVALTVLCYALLSSVQGLPRGGGSPPGRRLEEASSSSSDPCRRSNLLV